ncbi:hypothetical protein [Serratia marcescens]|uniref:hypothetical protein n=1 Tax=Serratia marcescens TaxID=615 RepID=UPI003F7CEDCD
MTRTLTTEQLNQINADIAARKAMPEYGESVEGNIERLRVIGETRSHFSTETVEMLVRALEEKSRALADAERERDDWVEHSRKMEYRANEAKEKLANREAQPVLYASEETLAYAKEGEKSLVTWSEPMGDAVIPLYTAPPAPAVLPEAFPDDIPQEHNINTYSGITWAASWNACRASRAAMLAQPVSQGYTLPPHVYRELVNCLRDTAVKYQGTQQLREQLSRTLMKNGLSAAAPEGGNDHDTRR